MRNISRVGTGTALAKAPPTTTLPLPLPRFTADELDDVDHSKTTKLDEVTLRRGKLPTVEQIAKYREVRARRMGGAVADALKESRIDCEVAQYVLERWAAGWGCRHGSSTSGSGLHVPWKDAPQHSIRAFDPEARRSGPKVAGLPAHAQCHPRHLRDTQPHRATGATRGRGAATAPRRASAAIAAERAAPQEMAKESEASRFDLIEPDPQADPLLLFAPGKPARQPQRCAQRQSHPRIAKPAAAPRRPAIEVVDAEMDGLSQSVDIRCAVRASFERRC